MYQDPACADNFLYKYTSLISAASWYTGGGGDNVLLNYFVFGWLCSEKNDIFPKISKIRQNIEVILSETNDG